MQEKSTAKILFEAALRLKLNPKIESSYGLLSLSINGSRQYIFSSSSPFNTQLSSYLANNKHATRVALDAARLPNIPYLLPVSREELNAFFFEHSEIIAKPTRGMRSRGVLLISTKKQLDQLNFKNMIFEKYIKGTELRILLLDGGVLAVHRRTFPGPINKPSKVMRIELSDITAYKDLIFIAQQAMETLGLRFGVVDFIVNDVSYILEVNSAPGLYFFRHPHQGAGIDIGTIYLEAVAKYFDPHWKSPV